MTIKNLAARLAESWPLERWENVNSIVGVSGGGDSVALLQAMCELHSCPAERITVAHFNHKLRAADSDDDQAFVKDLAGKLHLQFETAESTYAHSASSSHQGKGLEALARQERFDFFVNVAQKIGARYVVLAHHRDDQIETILQRIFRGANVIGMAGISQTRRLTDEITVVRPMLTVSRSDIAQALTEDNIAFRIDKSNFTAEFTRNRIRNELIPLITEIFGESCLDGTIRISETAKELKSLLDNVSQKVQVAFHEISPQQITIDLNKIVQLQTKDIVLRHAIRVHWEKVGWPLNKMTARHWICIAEFINSSEEVAAQILPGNIRMEKVANSVILSRGQNTHLKQS